MADQDKPKAKRVLKLKKTPALEAEPSPEPVPAEDTGEVDTNNPLLKKKKK